MYSNLFIVLEGIDGTGKSSISKELAERLQAKYFRCPPKVIMPFRKFADSSPYLVRYLYYLLGNFIAQNKIRALLKHSSVVCDWYIFSTIAYHSVLLDKKLRVPNILMPHKLIYLSATKEQIKTRLDDRQTKSKFENLDLLENVKREYEGLTKGYPGLIRIDTTDKTVNSSVDEILQAIK